jgi:hypothetical protein
LEQDWEQMRREAVGVFEEEMCRAMVAKQLVLRDNGKIWKAFLPVDLEFYGKWSKRAKKELI